MVSMHHSSLMGLAFPCAYQGRVRYYCLYERWPHWRLATRREMLARFSELARTGLKAAATGPRRPQSRSSGQSGGQSRGPLGVHGTGRGRGVVLAVAQLWHPVMAAGVPAGGLLVGVPDA